jgi:outer membrane lipoprotein-sorting protein
MLRLTTIPRHVQRGYSGRCDNGKYVDGAAMRTLVLIATLLLCVAPPHAQDAERDAASIVRDAINHWRGLSSYTEMSMVIHRPDWERSMTMRAWTKGDKKSLVRVIEPKKDRGNGTLTDDDNMWTFSPKVNRVIKIPSSMMGQSWMGSDFSNKDVARADDIIDQYDHSLLSTEDVEGITIYEIESIPHEEAAVVWGREVLTIRDDHVVLQHRFYDQDGELVKTLESLEIAEMGGRTVAKRQRMSKTESPEEWTEIQVNSVEYEIDIRDSMFTQSNLRNPRD